MIRKFYIFLSLLYIKGDFMAKILKKSVNGFMVEGTKKWFQVDKFKLINSDKFKNLKVSDDIDNIKFNNKDFVIDFIVLNHEDQEGKGEIKHISFPSNHNVKNSEQFPFTPESFHRSRDILKGQCLNIAFDGMGKLIEFKDERDRRIQIAQKLLNELESADFFNW